MGKEALSSGTTSPDVWSPGVHALGTLRLESGLALPDAKLAYATRGRLNDRGDNAILLPSHYMADHHGYDWLIGPAQALDPERHFLIATELFGNGRSSSPSNTPEPLHGPRFPVTTIRDNVAAVHDLLTRRLGVTTLRAVIGFSMGAQQAFQWAVSHPTVVGRIVATAGTAKCHPHGVVRLDGQLAALKADRAFAGGDYLEQPMVGVRAFGTVWAGWLYSQEWWRAELWREYDPPAGSIGEAVTAIVDQFVDADANDHVLQVQTWQLHDVGTTPGFDGDLERALGAITASVLYMPSATDLYFPIGDAEYERRFIPDCRFVPIPSLWGHEAGCGAGPADAAFLNDHIGRFVAAS